MIVYVLTNAAMPGIVKLGKTGNDNPEERIAQLYTTGVPVPFTLEYACRTENGDEVEKALHIAFNPQRVNPKREFFRIDPEQAIAILRLLHTDDITSQVSDYSPTIDKESIEAEKALRSRRPNYNFEEMGIPVGAVLESVDDDSTLEVVDNRKVKYKGQVTTLTAATRDMLGLEYSVSPGQHWTYNGRSVREIYNDTYPREE